MRLKEEASTAGEDEGVVGTGRYHQLVASDPLTVPLEWPPPCPAALETVRRALLDGVGDNGGGQPRRWWLSDLDERRRRRRRADAGARMRTTSGCGNGGTLECGERTGAKTAEARGCGGGGGERVAESGTLECIFGCEWTWEKGN